MNQLQKKLMEHLEKLSPGTTMCPGRLARQCGLRLQTIRPDLISLVEAGKIQLTQRGEVVRLDQLRGPFRVRLMRPGVHAKA